MKPSRFSPGLPQGVVLNTLLSNAWNNAVRWVILLPQFTDKSLGLREVRYSGKMSSEFSPESTVQALSTKLTCLFLRPSFYPGVRQGLSEELSLAFNDLLTELLSPPSRNPSGAGPYLIPSVTRGPASSWHRAGISAPWLRWNQVRSTSRLSPHFHRTASVIRMVTLHSGFHPGSMISHRWPGSLPRSLLPGPRCSGAGRMEQDRMCGGHTCPAKQADPGGKDESS